MSNVEQLERETEQTRSQIANTLGELKACMTPGHVLHQLADRMSDGAAAAFARNLKQQTVNNPLPVALIGAGLAWLMLSPRGPKGMRGSGDRLGDAGNDAAENVRDAVDAAQGGAAQAADTVRETAGSISDSMQRTAGTVSESTKAAGQRTLQSGSAFLAFCREQPMVLAGLGLAAGAVLGALLPTSETEDQLMGEASDRVKERAQDLASQQHDSAKKVGERALDAAKDEAVQQADEQGWAGGTKDEKQAPAGEPKADDATLVPSDESELERRGQPWTTENAPV